MTDAADHPARAATPDRLRKGWATALTSWEAILVLLLIGVFVGNSIATPWFLDVYNLADATYNFSEKAIIALPRSSPRFAPSEASEARVMSLICAGKR